MMIKNIKNTFKTVNRFWNNLLLLFDKIILQYLYNIHNIIIFKQVKFGYYKNNLNN